MGAQVRPATGPAAVNNTVDGMTSRVVYVQHITVPVGIVNYIYAGICVAGDESAVMAVAAAVVGCSVIKIPVSYKLDRFKIVGEPVVSQNFQIVIISDVISFGEDRVLPMDL